jgi:hypothetical protein
MSLSSLARAQCAHGREGDALMFRCVISISSSLSCSRPSLLPAQLMRGSDPSMSLVPLAPFSVSAFNEFYPKEGLAVLS